MIQATKDYCRNFVKWKDVRKPKAWQSELGMIIKHFCKKRNGSEIAILLLQQFLSECF